MLILFRNINLYLHKILGKTWLILLSAGLIVGIFAIELIVSLFNSGPLVPINRDRFSSINLAQLHWYARQGFSPADINGFNATDPTVKAVNRLPIPLNALFSIPAGNQVNEFTLMTSFSLPPESAARSLMLHLAEVGENFAVYLNGTEIRQEIYLNADGQIDRYRSLQRVLIPIPPGAARDGTNTLVFRIIGNPPVAPLFTAMMPGFPMANNYTLGDSSDLIREHSVQNASSWIQIGIYFFFGIYQFLFFRRRREKYALYFGLFLIAFGFYSFFNSNLSFENIPDTSIITRALYVTSMISIGLLAMVQWSYLYPDWPAPKMLRILVGLNLLGILGILLTPFQLLEAVMRSSLPVLAAIIGYLFYLIINAIRKNVQGARDILYAVIFVAFTVVWAFLDLFFLRTGLDLVSWAPFILAIAFMLVFIDRFWQLSIDLAESNRQLAINRDSLEVEVKVRTQELVLANATLAEQLNEINQLHVVVTEQALHDPLTGLLNRRSLAEILDFELSHARNSGQPVSLVMMDIDHFKLLNDTFGHKTGDLVLAHLGELLLSHSRHEDYIFRFGGEEFLIILPNAPLEAACRRAEEWRKAVEALGQNILDHPQPITVSIGIAVYPWHGSLPDELLSQADAALYKAKENGRNRVESADPVVS